MIGRILIVLCLSLSGCSGSPIAPTGTAGFPDIAGTYSGTLTLTITGAPGHPPMRGTSTLVVTVTQSAGKSPQLIWDGVRGTIDAIGIFTGPEAKGLNGRGLWPGQVQEPSYSVLSRHSQPQSGR